MGENALSHNSVNDEFFDSASARVFGDIAPGEAFGAAWAYEFELILNLSSTANVFLDSSGTGAFLDSGPADDGVGFASAKLFSFDVGFNDPGGANNPYDQELFSLVAPQTGGAIDSPITLSHLFSNPGGTSKTFNLRLEGAVSIFENAIPEPSSLVLVALGGLAVALRRRGRKEDKSNAIK